MGGKTPAPSSGGFGNYSMKPAEPIVTQPTKSSFGNYNIKQDAPKVESNN